MNNLQKVGELLLPTVAYGDAAGLPVETKTAAEIAAHYGIIDCLVPPVDNPYYAGEYPAGTWSDDTQLTIAVIEALMRAGSFDIWAMAESHVAAYQNTPLVAKSSGKLIPRGWGGSVSSSIKRIIEGVSPLESGHPEGTGNGVLMKLAPLAFWQVAQDISDQECNNQYDQLTRMTHNTTLAQICTRVHGDTLRYLLSEGSSKKTTQHVANFALGAAQYHEALFGDSDKELSSALEFLKMEPINKEVILKYTDGKGFYVPQTLAMAYANFIAGNLDFTKTIYGGVNLGGDTDSIASISGTMVNFAAGATLELPSDISTVQDIGRLQKLSERFTKFALKEEV